MRKNVSISIRCHKCLRSTDVELVRLRKNEQVLCKHCEAEIGQTHDKRRVYRIDEETGEITVGKILKSARLERGLRQRDLARISGVSQGHISRMEAGLNVNVGSEILEKLERALGEPVVRLRAIGTPKNPSPELKKFLLTEEAETLELSEEEVDQIMDCRWYSEGEHPTTLAWVDFVRARRGLKKDW